MASRHCRRGHLWRPAPAIVPAPAVSWERAGSVQGAYRPPEELRGQDEPSLGRYPVPEPFDWFTIQPTVLGTSTTLLIGRPGNAAPVQSRAVAPGRRGCVFSIATYLESASGAVVSPGRIPFPPGAAAAVNWSILVNDRPYGDYGNVLNTVLASWDSLPGEIPMLELREGDALSCTATVVDPNKLFAQIGIRIRGQFLPWSDDASVHLPHQQLRQRGKAPMGRAPSRRERKELALPVGPPPRGSRR